MRTGPACGFLAFRAQDDRLRGRSALTPDAAFAYIAGSRAGPPAASLFLA